MIKVNDGGDRSGTARPDASNKLPPSILAAGAASSLLYNSRKTANT